MQLARACRISVSERANNYPAPDSAILQLLLGHDKLNCAKLLCHHETKLC
jgi:hypothetical protein